MKYRSALTPLLVCFAIVCSSGLSLAISDYYVRIAELLVGPVVERSLSFPGLDSGIRPYRAISMNIYKEDIQKTRDNEAVIRGYTTDCQKNDVFPSASFVGNYLIDDLSFIIDSEFSLLYSSLSDVTRITSYIPDEIYKKHPTLCFHFVGGGGGIHIRSKEVVLKAAHPDLDPGTRIEPASPSPSPSPIG